MHCIYEEEFPSLKRIGTKIENRINQFKSETQVGNVKNLVKSMRARKRALEKERPRNPPNPPFQSQSRMGKAKEEETLELSQFKVHFQKSNKD